MTAVSMIGPEIIDCRLFVLMVINTKEITMSRGAEFFIKGPLTYRIAAHGIAEKEMNALPIRRSG